MDFTLSPEIEDIRLRVRDFVDEHVLPLEADPANFADHENIPQERLEPVRAKAKKAGLWAPQVAEGIRRHGAADRRLGRRCTRRRRARSSVRSPSTAWRRTTAT